MSNWVVSPEKYLTSDEVKQLRRTCLDAATIAKSKGNQAPVGDAMVTIDGLDNPVAPGSTIGGCLLVNAIKAEVAERLTRAGRPPTVLTGPALIGVDRAAELFESAYDEYAHSLAKLYENVGRRDA